MTDRSDRDLLDERMDDRLRETGARWRSALPAPAEPAPASGRTPRAGRRWLVPAAAAAVVVVILGTTFAVTGGRDGSDPAGRDAAPCGPGDLVPADRELDREGATASLTLLLHLSPDAAACTVEGYPDVVLMEHGILAPMEHEEVLEGPDPEELVVDADHPVLVMITWGWSVSCGRRIDNDLIRITAGDGAVVEVKGFGRSDCGFGLDIHPFTAADPSPDTALTGLVRLEGPLTPRTVPQSGEVTATGRAGTFTSPILNEGDAGDEAGEYDGDYRINLPPGRYEVVVTSPELAGRTCRRTVRVRVAEYATMLDITCRVG